MTITYHDIKQGSSEWLTLKAGIIGGSRVKQVFAKNNLPFIDLLISELMTGRIEEMRITPAMQNGIDLEPLALGEYKKQTGNKLKSTGMITNSLYPRCGLSPDSLAVDAQGKVYGAVEAKCPNPKNHAQYIRTNTVPAEYKYQVMHYFYIEPSIQWVDFISYCPSFKYKKLHIVRVNRDDIEMELYYNAWAMDKFMDKLSKYEAKVMEVEF